MANIVVTGATSGIGLHTATTLAGHGHDVVITGRDPDRGERAVRQIHDETGARVGLELGDLSERSSLRELARRLGQRFASLDVLINNAGVMARDATVTTDGLALNTAVNVAAPYRLTEALRPMLVAAARGRVVNVTGGAPIGALSTRALGAAGASGGLKAYSNAKRGLEALSLLHARDLARDGIDLVIVYPGAAATTMTAAMTRHDLPLPMQFIWPFLRRTMHSDDQGSSAAHASRSSVFASTNQRLRGSAGDYYDTHSRPAKLHRSVHKPANQQAVLQLLKTSKNKN